MPSTRPPDLSIRFESLAFYNSNRTFLVSAVSRWISEPLFRQETTGRAPHLQRSIFGIWMTKALKLDTVASIMEDRRLNMRDLILGDPVLLPEPCDGELCGFVCARARNVTLSLSRADDLVSFLFTFPRRWLVNMLLLPSHNVYRMRSVHQLDT
jgi:hypothetical protein